LPDAWPNSTPVADGAVAAARLVRGEVVAPDAGWNVEDFVVALDARIPHVKGALCTYKAGVQKLNDKLFRSRAEPIPNKTNEDVARNLKAAPRQLETLLDSAFRSGVQATLAIVKSWYPTVDLKLLRALRDESDAEVGAVWIEICHLAAELAHSVNLLEYTPRLDDAGRPISAAGLSNLQYTSSEDTEAQAAPRDRDESSRSRYLDDEDYDDDEDAEEEGEGSSAEHSEAPVPPSTQPEATATSAPGGVAHTSPAAPTSGDVASAELVAPASASAAPGAPIPDAPTA
jgi:hypothetical protein